MPRIYYAADSTVAQNKILSYPQTGIGQALPLFLKSTVFVENYAVNGRSTKSFIDEGRLDAIDQNISPGDFLFIQFGHNDEKKEDPTRYTEPFGRYQENLEAYIRVAKSHGAYPVLITPLYRRCFDENGKLPEGNHGDYPEAMRQIAKKHELPLLDLCKLSYELLLATGDEESKKWFMNFPAGLYANEPDGKTDNTHLRMEGAIVFAEIIARELKKAGERYADLILDELYN